MEIITFGKGERLMRAARLLSSSARGREYRRLILLPIPTTRDSRHITATDTPLEEVLLSTDEGTLVVGYGLTVELCEAIALLGGDAADAGENEEFLRRNAEVTARGAVGYILTNSEKDIQGLKIGIIGYGRIGKALLRILLFLGASVRVYTTRETVAAELCESGVCCEVITDGTYFGECEVILNTAPARLIPESRIKSELRDVKIIDLASGQLYQNAENLTKLSSVPEAFYPETAGRLYAEYALSALGEEAEK